MDTAPPGWSAAVSKMLRVQAEQISRSDYGKMHIGAYQRRY